MRIADKSLTDPQEEQIQEWAYGVHELPKLLVRRSEKGL
jgi:hypothetical protein